MDEFANGHRARLLRDGLTRDEQRNGWTVETLAKYLAGREREQVDAARRDAERQLRAAVTENVQTFNPHNW